MTGRIVAAGLPALLLATGPALAHGAERGFVMLLPTGHVMAAGAAAVAVSFLVLALVPAERMRRVAGAGLPLGSLPRPATTGWSLASAALLVALVLVGLLGYQDPLLNPLAITIWTLWWVGFPLVHAVFGNLWAALNPFVGPYRLLDRASGGALAADRRDGGLLRLGHGTAIATFLGFAWFELVDPAPDRPERLAVVTAIYAILTMALVATHGERWLDRSDPFAVFFRFVAGLSPLTAEPVPGRPDRVRLVLRLPGAALLSVPAMPLLGVVFVLLTLSTVSFDGLSKTFRYLAVIGVNPLEFPGRSAVIGPNTVGLVAAFAALTAAYFAAVAAGWRLAGRPVPFALAAGRLVASIVPISIAFHLSHYLTALMVNGQYALLAANDPFGLGWNLIGMRGYLVTTSFLTSASGSTAVFAAQTVIIVTGHVIAVAVAHLVAADLTRGRGAAARLEAPLAALMVGYTVFGLWLLSTPVAG